jgi:hypothetical protein
MPWSCPRRVPEKTVSAVAADLGAGNAGSQGDRTLVRIGDPEPHSEGSPGWSLQ